VYVNSRDVTSLRSWKIPHFRRSIGCVFQDFRLLPNKTVHQNVAYALQILGASRSRIRQTVPETLELVGLAGKGKRLPHQLSGGEQQRVAIARAFVNRPPILLADEPTGNLDPDTSLEIVKLLDRINRTGTTVVMATHDTATVNEMRKRVIRLEGGVLVADVEAGDYTTGSIPRIRREAEIAEVAEVAGRDEDPPEGAPDVLQEEAIAAYEAEVEGGLPPIGRDADAPRPPRPGLFRRSRRTPAKTH
jgi:cell division transport system ATP-binding protein